MARITGRDVRAEIYCNCRRWCCPTKISPEEKGHPMSATEARAERSEPAVGEIPRDYNFAADIFDRNLKAGRAEKPVYIDPRGSWTYGQLAERVEKFGMVLRELGIAREQRVLMCMTDTIDWP